MSTKKKSRTGSSSSLLKGRFWQSRRTPVKVSMLSRSIQAWISDSIEAATREMEWVEAPRVRKDLRVLWWPWDLWRVSTRALRSERCWERAERYINLQSQETLVEMLDIELEADGEFKLTKPC
ncbi:hypothetical protein FH972_010807 [Carpinus fangiana]|uniref:Uncharacterized protein n=1 Tax=Carpinus fangiana TaxID=176857 RepID=A0A660KPE2_9ROSI|nr:hypothetical protein FH972_010807 [Carpinus fangiana]